MGEKGSSEQYLFNPVPVHQFCHLRKRRRTFEWEDKNVSPELLASVKEIISEGSPTGMFQAMAKGRGTIQRERRELELPQIPDFILSGLCDESVWADVSEGLNFDVSEELQEFYQNNVHVMKENIIEIFRKTVGQDNSTWRRERQIRITGTTAHLFKTKKKDVDWRLKCQRIILPKKPFLDNPATRYGKAHEPVALRIVQENFPENSVLSELGLCININFPMFGFSPDGIMQDTGILLEVKCPVTGQTYCRLQLCERLPYLVKLDESNNALSSYSLKTTHTYYTQIQLGLSILNLRSAQLVIYYNVKQEDGKKDEGVIMIPVQRNDEFCKSLLSTLGCRYFEFVLPFLHTNRTKLLL